ncbi:unnamed protein product [Hanseniaspora opuntiae]
MVSFNKSEKKLPNVKIISNSGQLLNTINENFQHILTEFYDKDIVPPQNDVYIASSVYPNNSFCHCILHQHQV